MRPINVSEQQQHNFHGYWNHVTRFISDTLCADELNDADDFIPGTERIEFYPKKIALQISDPNESDSVRKTVDYERSLYNWVASIRRPTVLVSIGGLGTGKSTVLKYVVRLIESDRQRLIDEESCKCGPRCSRRPLILDCINDQADGSADDTSRTIFRHLRFAIYRRVLGEWLQRHGRDPKSILSNDRRFNILRRLLISNDIYLDGQDLLKEDLPYPARVGELDLDGRLLNVDPTDDFLETLDSKYGKKRTY